MKAIDSPLNLDRTPYERCFAPLLQALHWRGLRRDVIEALPHFSEVHNALLFCQVMQILGFDSESFALRLDELDKRLLPCLFVADDGNVLLILDARKNSALLYDATKKILKRVKQVQFQGVAYVFKKRPRLRVGASRQPWFSHVWQQHKKTLARVMEFGFVLSLLNLGTPLFIMAIYNQVVGTHAPSSSIAFLIGVALAIVGATMIQKIRSRLVSSIGTDISQSMGDAVFKKILFLPAAYTEGASIGSQIAKIRDFSALRSFISGPMMITFLEIPFIAVLLFVIGLLGGILVWIPIISTVLFAVMVFIKQFYSSKDEEANSKNYERQEFLIEALQKQHTIKMLQLEGKWIEKERNISGDNSYENFINSVKRVLDNSVSDFIVAGAGTVLLGISAVMIMDQRLNVGTMIAVMILIWRSLSPIKSLYIYLPRFLQIRRSMLQFNALMTIESEDEGSPLTFRTLPKIRGDIVMNQVGFRYPNAIHPALVNINLHIYPGELIALTGPNGSGKSTLLKLLLGLYMPQVGTIYVDGVDLRQFDLINYRKTISYSSQISQLFYGTVEQNLRLANPLATPEQLMEATKITGVYDMIKVLEAGFDTPLSDYARFRFSESFQFGLCLARAYLKNSRFILLDEPVSNFDEKFEQHFLNTIHQWRGKSTIIMCTHRFSHIQMADRVLLLDKGRLQLLGKPSEAIEKIRQMKE